MPVAITIVRKMGEIFGLDAETRTVRIVWEWRSMKKKEQYLALDGNIPTVMDSSLYSVEFTDCINCRQLVLRYFLILLILKDFTTF